MQFDSNTGLPTGGQSRGALADWANSSAGKSYLANAKSAEQATQNIGSVAQNSVVSDLGAAQKYIEYVSGITARNNAISQSNAREQMQFQRDANALAMAFNSLEAQKSRNWQAFMSNTAHQREVQDLIAAGLNPILSANSGASTPSGATASGVTSSGAMGNVDTSASGAVASLIGTVMQAAATLQATNVNAKTNLEISRINADTQRYLGQLSAAASKYTADSHYSGTRYSADRGYAASVYGSNIARDVANIQSSTQYGINSANIANQKYLQISQQDFDAWKTGNFPTTLVGAFSSLLNPNKGFSDFFNWAKSHLR